MISHLLAQYEGKPFFDALLYAVGAECDAIDTVLSDLKNKRWIDTGVGYQLDGVGKIVDRPRLVSDAIALNFFGFNGQNNVGGFGVYRFRSMGESPAASASLPDPEYQQLLWNKVFKNNAGGTAEDTITSISKMFPGVQIILTENGDASFTVTFGSTLTGSQKQLANALNLLVRGAGISCTFSYS